VAGEFESDSNYLERGLKHDIYTDSPKCSMGF